MTFKVSLYGTDGVLISDELTAKQITENGTREYVISDEAIRIKRALLGKNKRNLLNFDKSKLIVDRKKLSSDVASVLATDDSLLRMVFTRHYAAPKIEDNTVFSNNNLFISNLGNVSTEILNYLDPIIEYLSIENTDKLRNGQTFYRLKFKGREKEITDNNFATIDNYLSSGTAKGISLYIQISVALKTVATYKGKHCLLVPPNSKYVHLELGGTNNMEVNCLI